jgi:hypothetical protein
MGRYLPFSFQSIPLCLEIRFSKAQLSPNHNVTEPSRLAGSEWRASASRQALGLHPGPSSLSWPHFSSLFFQDHLLLTCSSTVRSSLVTVSWQGVNVTWAAINKCSMLSTACRGDLPCCSGSSPEAPRLEVQARSIHRS